MAITPASFNGAQQFFNNMGSIGSNIRNAWHNSQSAIYQMLHPSVSSVSEDTSAEDYQYEQNLALQKQSQEFNAQQAEVERQWQERMSNSAYQRAVNDLQRAGLNPWLAAQNGFSGASSGLGAAASSSANRVEMGATATDKYNAKTGRMNAYTNRIATYGNICIGIMKTAASSAMAMAALL